MASMPIENGKKLTFWPPVTNFLRRFLNIQHDRNSIFIIISYYTLVCICCVGFNNTVFFLGAFRRFKIWQIHVRNLKWKRFLNLLRCVKLLIDRL
jgi:hypothetical protein